MPRPLLTALLLSFCFPAFSQAVDTTLYCDLPVYFGFGADSLNAPARRRLQQLAADIRELPGLQVRLIAHTDAVGRARANLELSGRRAQTVARLLSAAGIPGTVIQWEKQGEQNPVADNHTPRGRQQNRRVEVRVHTNLPMRRLSGQIISKESGEGVPATVLLSTPTWSDSLQADTAGRFSSSIPALETVRMDAFAEGFFFDTQILQADTAADTVLATLPLPPAKAGAKLPVKRLHFLGGQAVLRPKSVPELHRLRRFMQLNAGLGITIHGHVNVPNSPPVSEDSESYQLSEARARYIYDYLTEQGIDPARLSWEAHGNWEMLYPKAVSQGQQAANRRVEIEVE